MELMYTLHGGSERTRTMPINPGADILVGAGLCYGTTTAKSALIRGTSAWPDFAGIAAEALEDDTNGTVAAGTLDKIKVIFEPTAIYRAMYESTDKIDVTSATSTAVTVPTITDDNDGGYMYCFAGIGLGQLRYIGTATTTVLTVGTGMTYTTTLTSASDIILLPPAGTQAVDFEATACKVKGDCGSGVAGRVHVLSNWIESDSISRTEMNPASHGNLDGLNSNTKLNFWCELVFSNTVLHKID